MLREELQLLQEQGSYVGEVIKAMDKKKVLVKIHPEGKFVVDIDPKLKMEDIKPTTRVALKSDSYVLHKILPNKVNMQKNISRDGQLGTISFQAARVGFYRLFTRNYPCL
jgi:ATP-dependent 26S proteasome regulatory subunit